MALWRGWPFQVKAQNLRIAGLTRSLREAQVRVTRLALLTTQVALYTQPKSNSETGTLCGLRRLGKGLRLFPEANLQPKSPGHLRHTPLY
jgi:hypothetical protein